jgi:hypothetical protein
MSCLSAATSGAEANVDQIDPVIQSSFTAMVRAYENALSNRSFDGLAPFLSSGFSAVTASGEEISSIEELNASKERMKEQLGDGGSHKTEVMPALIQQISAELVLVSGITKDKVLDEVGNVFEFQTKWTAFSVKEGGAWKLRRVHVSMNPLDNAFTQFSKRGVKITYGLLAGLLGLLVGGVLTALLIGRRTRSRDLA